jgi:hypothetical protein
MLGSMRKFLFFLGFLSFVSIVGAAEVPWPAKIGDWTLESGQSARANNPATLGADLAKESGLLSTISKNYHAGGNRTIPLTLYQFKDSSGAYEAYNFLRAHSDGPDRGTFIVKGNLVLLVGFLPENSPELPPAAQWLNSASDHVASPPIATYLPEKNKDPQSERYALGPVAFRRAATELGRSEMAGLTDVTGFQSGAEAMFGQFKSGKDAATLLLVEYPTPQLAELHLRHLQRALADAKLTTSSIERKGSLLSIVLAPTSPEYAAKLRASVNYETSVTWNEASQTATDPPIMSTVVKIFIATGVFMVVTVVIGIAFGGVRVITKRLFPGKVFDRKEQIEVLQLGLSGKPIDPTDLY